MPDAPVLPALKPVYLWPENLEAWNLFQCVQTQWRGHGMGREGLDYEGVHRVIDQRRQWRTRRRQCFELVQLMEAAVLIEWAERTSDADRRG